MSKQILIADTDPLISNLLRSSLVDKGFEVLSVSTACDAVKEFHANSGLRLVVLDRNLADTEGVEALKEIRRSPRPVPVWYLTPAADACAVAELVNHGADAVLIKSVDVKALVEEICAFVDKPTVILQVRPAEAPSQDRRPR